MSKARVLIIDDDEGYLDSLEMLLAAHGYETGRMTRGRHYLDSAIAGDWDCILLDFDLPDMTAFELLERCPPDRRSPPVLLISAGSGDWQERARDYPGIRSSFAKPIAPERLLREIEALIAGSDTGSSG